MTDKSRRAALESLVIEAVANDFENFETILSEVRRWSIDEQISASDQEIQDALSALAARGDIVSFELSSKDGKSKPVNYEPTKLKELWFFPSPRVLDEVRKQS